MGVVVAQTCSGVPERLNPFWLRLSGGNWDPFAILESIRMPSGINAESVSYGLFW